MKHRIQINGTYTTKKATLAGGTKYFTSSSTNFAITGPLLLCTWVRPTSTGGEGDLIAKMNYGSTQGYSLAINGTSYFVRAFDGTTKYQFNGKMQVTQVDWYFLAGYYDGTGIHGFWGNKNNLLYDGYKAAGSSLATTTNPLAIGTASDALGSSYLVGDIANPMIVSGSLGSSFQSVIADIFNQGPIATPVLAAGTMVAYYTFANSDGTDNSGNGNTLTVTGVPTYATMQASDIARNTARTAL